MTTTELQLEMPMPSGHEGIGDTRAAVSHPGRPDDNPAPPGTQRGTMLEVSDLHFHQRVGLADDPDFTGFVIGYNTEAEHVRVLVAIAHAGQTGKRGNHFFPLAGLVKRAVPAGK